MTREPKAYGAAKFIIAAIVTAITKREGDETGEGESAAAVGLEATNKEKNVSASAGADENMKTRKGLGRSRMKCFDRAANIMNQATTTREGASQVSIWYPSRSHTAGSSSLEMYCFLSCPDGSAYSMLLSQSLPLYHYNGVVQDPLIYSNS